MAIEADGDYAIIVSADIVHLSDAQFNYVREKVAKLTNEIDVRKIMIGATHTHTSIGMGAPKAKNKEYHTSVTTAKEALKEFLPEGI